MINSTEQVKDRMSSYLTYVASDRRALETEGGRAAVNKRMRRDQIDLIRSYWNDFDDVELARAKRTLDQIGGDDFELAL